MRMCFYFKMLRIYYRYSSKKVVLCKDGNGLGFFVKNSDPKSGSSWSSTPICSSISMRDQPKGVLPPAPTPPKP